MKKSSNKRRFLALPLKNISISNVSSYISNNCKALASQAKNRPLLAGLIAVLSLSGVFALAFGLFINSSSVQAETSGWNLSEPQQYIYEMNKIVFAGGSAVFSGHILPPTPTDTDQSKSEQEVSQGPVASEENTSQSENNPSESQEITNNTTETPTIESNDNNTDSSTTLSPSTQQEGSNQGTTEPSSTPPTTAPSDTPSEEITVTETPNTETPPVGSADNSNTSITPTDDTNQPAQDNSTPTEVAPVTTETTPEAPAIEAQPSNPVEQFVVATIIRPLRNLSRFFTKDSSTLPAYANELSCRASLQPISSITPSNLSSWTRFIDDSTVSGNAAVMYQLSDDGGNTWYYWNGLDWVSATDENSMNTANTINENIFLFPTATSLTFRSFFMTDCSSESSVSLSSVKLVYDQFVLKNKKQTFRTIPPSENVLVDSNGNTVNGEANAVYVTSGTPRVAYMEFVGELNLATSKIMSDGITSMINIDNEGMQHISKLELLIPRNTQRNTVVLCSKPTNLVSIMPGCFSEVQLSPSKPQSGHYTLVKLSDQNYWHVDIAITGPIHIGGASIQ